MARGRMISNEITRDKRVNDLSGDTSRLAFTWIVTFADVEGRTYGDPALVRSMLFPRRTDISVEQMESYIQEWHDLGLIIWYEAQDDLWIAFPNFEKHQVGLRKDRETPSSIPSPPGYTPPEGEEDDGDEPDDDGSDDGEMPDESPVKLSEVKAKVKAKVKGSESEYKQRAHTPAERRDVLDYFFAITGLPKFRNNKDAEAFADLLDQYGGQKLRECIDWIAGKDSMTTPKAISSMKTALPNWSSASKNHRGKSSELMSADEMLAILEANKPDGDE